MNPIYIGGVAITLDIGYKAAVLTMLSTIAYNSIMVVKYFYG